MGFEFKVSKMHPDVCSPGQGICAKMAVLAAPSLAIKEGLTTALGGCNPPLAVLREALEKSALFAAGSGALLFVRANRLNCY